MTVLALAFLGTNVDGFSCLAAAFALDPPRNRIHAVIAAAAGFVLLLGIAMGASMAMQRFHANVAWFGIVPAGIGVARLVRAVRGAKGKAESDWLSSHASIFAIVLATGADNVAVYAPLFAVRSAVMSLGVSAAFLAVWIAGCAALAYATPALARVKAIEPYLEPVLGVFFIAMGIAIFAGA